ncbi:DUF2530 domain-containing protein [Luteipulveratus sp. YIM 133132]|uniref:DUF2530 domain-containing protein n=1 Tax=Luteipulveratus flavus TaxID=3031728 RepID=A0ABT6C988_9MICO|nr:MULTISPECIES: DUF2530 domain-containing protein [unclassified Luteipulveratus]MDE9365051.1 DUF2530 domain-containing protein [Luteipulveratus sp. YIM 133132]MDF8264609.1 DUF2530 domain-containing protein [Luteipulveratus sp. YIM 133296]
MTHQAVPAHYDPDHPTPLPFDTLRVVEIGLAVWAVVLVVLLAVPTLHQGSRDWWPWVPVAALALGSLGWAYLRRGRGNAADA